MNEMIWFAIGFAITLIVIATLDTVLQCKSALK